MTYRQVRKGFVPIVGALAFIGATAIGGSANAATAAVASITTKPGILHHMPSEPAPNGAPEAAAAQQTTIAPGIPIGAERLRKIKEGAPGPMPPGGAALAQEADGASGPEQQGVLLKNCNAQAAEGFAPSDSHGAVGPTNFVSISNVSIRVQNKVSCAIVSSQTLVAFFAPVGVAAGTVLFDPRAIYDRNNARCFVTAESRLSGSNNQFQYFGVSTNSLCTSYRLYRITLSSGRFRFCKKAVSSFWDYPSAGHSRSTLRSQTRARWFIVANDFGSFVDGRLLDINKFPTLSGGSTVVACFTGLPFNLAPPITLDAPTVATFLSPGSGSGSVIQRRNLNLSTSGPASDTISNPGNVAITAWTAPPNAAQPNGELLDTLDGRFQSASIQSRGLLWNVKGISRSTTSGPRAAFRLYKLSQAGALQMQLTLITNTVDNIFNPSFATGSGAFNAPGFLTVTRTIPTLSTGRAATLMFSGLNSSTSGADWSFNTLVTSPSQFTGCGSGCRWGDYSATQVDPSGSGRAWGWNQFITGPTQFNWQMRVGQVELNLSTAPVAAAAAAAD